MMTSDEIILCNIKGVYTPLVIYDIQCYVMIYIYVDTSPDQDITSTVLSTTVLSMSLV